MKKWLSSSALSATIFIVATTPALAALFDGASGGGNATLSTITTGATGTIEGIKLLILNLASLLGVIVFFGGIYKIWQHNKPGQENHGHLKLGIAGFLIGPVLYFLPWALGVAGRTWLSF